MNKLHLLMLLTMLMVGLCLSLSCGDDDDDNDDNDDNDADDDDDDNDADDDDDDDDDTADPDDATGAGDTWIDPTTGLEWQNGDNCCNTWYFAENYCLELTWGGYSDWRLPTISELRSLIRGCDATVTGGECPASDDCNDYDCETDACLGCQDGQGPGDDGFYMVKGLVKNGYMYWTNSAVPGTAYTWTINFYSGMINLDVPSGIYTMRCVR